VLSFHFQTDVENVREELQFKNHKLSEWENLLLAERENTKTLGDELEVKGGFSHVASFGHGK
jgi:hypothetical protein